MLSGQDLVWQAKSAQIGHSPPCIVPHIHDGSHPDRGLGAAPGGDPCSMDAFSFWSMHTARYHLGTLRCCRRGRPLDRFGLADRSRQCRLPGWSGLQYATKRGGGAVKTATQNATYRLKSRTPDTGDSHRKDVNTLKSLGYPQRRFATQDATHFSRRDENALGCDRSCRSAVNRTFSPPLQQLASGCVGCTSRGPCRAC